MRRRACRLQALMDAAAKLDTLGVVVCHRGYEMVLSFEPADEEHVWVVRTRPASLTTRARAT